MEADVEAVIAEGNMDVEAVHTMLMNLTPSTVTYTMKVSREYRDKGKGVDRDMAWIRVDVTAPDSDVVLITYG